MSVARPRVWLVGLSGSGKSTVASLLAGRLGDEWSAVDTDALIEQRAGRTIPEIFESEGEEHFRELEAEAMMSVAAGENVIIATGGGAILHPANRLAMEDGIVAWLQIEPAFAATRLSAQSGAHGRPLLAGDDVEARLTELRDSRLPYYRRADIRIAVDELAPANVADRLEEAIRAAPPGAPYRLEPDTAAVVSTPTARYPIVVRPGLLGALGEAAVRLGLTGRAFLLADDALPEEHTAAAARSLRDARETTVIPVPGSEPAKTLATVERIYEQLLDYRADRSDFIVSLGGGVVTDMAGFAAATYLRGLPFVHVPTTLLGMVDAAIGGKTGVDLARGKNLVGAFAQPAAVLIDPAALATLPERHIRNGWAELIKHAFILGAEFDPDLLADLEAAAAAGTGSLAPELIARSVAIKARIVGEDERESARRTLLNYGHTIGHAIEAASGYETYLHGEAVAIGMHAAGLIARELDLLPGDHLERQQALVRACGLPESAPGLDPDAILEATTLDKKSRGGTISWVLLERLGKATLRKDVPPEVVRTAVEQVTR